MVETSGPVLIATGFYIAQAGKPATDGPPGALALARGLELLGRRVSFVTDDFCATMLETVSEGRPVHVIPVCDVLESRHIAKSILEAEVPGLLIAIERCGPSAEGAFLQFSGVDTTRFTGRIECLFDD